MDDGRVHELARSDIEQIVEIQLRLLNERLAEQNATLELTAAAQELLVSEGFDPQYGARPLSVHPAAHRGPAGGKLLGLEPLRAQ